MKTECFWIFKNQCDLGEEQKHPCKTATDIWLLWKFFNDQNHKVSLKHNWNTEAFFLPILVSIISAWLQATWCPYYKKCSVKNQCFWPVFNRSGSRIFGWLGTDPIQGFDDQKFCKIYSWKKIKCYFDQKLQFTYPSGLQKGRPSYRRSLQPSKENIQHVKIWNFFSLFYGVIFALLDPDPDSESGYGSTDLKHCPKWLTCLVSSSSPRVSRREGSVTDCLK